ncbi:MAG: hypothetical protein PHI41_03950 [Erysipelotrichaceae bacterium]|nr:hypothetical protein [Erysipelotrichaceae bacterium]MDD3809030.1 hypothetical protein [Erysipelotrichaceae bacterium]
MNEKFKSDFDQIKASPELKNQTLNQIYRQTSPRRRRSYFSKAVLSSLAIFLAVFLSFNYFNKAQAVMALSLDGDLAVEMEVDSDNGVIKISGYDDSSEELINAQDYLSANYLDVISSLQGKVVNPLAITVVYFNDNAKIDSSLTGVTFFEQFNYQEAHRYNMTFGKYQACMRLAQLSDEFDIEDCIGLSYNQVQMQIKNQEQHQNGNDNPNVNSDSGDGNSNQNAQGNGTNSGSNKNSNGH